jgi:hypothetical protein
MDIATLVLSRDEYMLRDWMGLSGKTAEIFDSIYHDNGDTFYDGLQPTSFANSLLKGIEYHTIEKVYIMSHCSPNGNSSKERFIEKHFHHPKFEFVAVPYTKTKSQVINEMDIDYMSFVDDSLTNIMDVMKNTVSGTRDFTMPRLGYNAITDDLAELVEEKFARLGYYSQVI